MTPHRQNGRGTYFLDRTFDSIGRIHLASGTNDLPTFRAIDAMLTALYDTGRPDLLIEIRDRRVKPVVALGWYRLGKLDRIPTGEMLRPFRETWEGWMVTLTDASDSHLRDLRTTLKALAPGQRPIADAAELLQALLITKAGKGRTIAKAKANLQAFIRDTLGNDHALYRAVRRIRTPRVVVERKGRPLAPAEVRELMARLPADVAGMVWTMCATGMGQKEYWGPWRLERDRVAIDGTKRAGRKRVVPFWTVLVRPSMGHRKLARQVARASSGAVTLRDFRRSFARWCEEAGIIETNCAAYMGHGPKTMTHLYRIGVVEGQLLEDAGKLQRFAGEPGLRLHRAEGA